MIKTTEHTKINDCDLCGKSEKMLLGNDFSSAQCHVWIQAGTLEIESLYEDYDQFQMKINYCPVCGRNLNQDNNHGN